MAEDEEDRRLRTELTLLRTERSLGPRTLSEPVDVSVLLDRPPLGPSEPLGEFSGVVAVGAAESWPGAAGAAEVEVVPELREESLAADLADCDAVVVLDPEDFPFEAVWRTCPDVPLDVCLDDLADEAVRRVVDQCGLLRSLTFLDRVVIRDDRLWLALRSGTRLAEGQRVRRRDELRAVSADAEAFHRRGPRDPIDYWRARAHALATSSPHQSVGSVRHGRRVNKRLFLEQRDVLRPHLPEQPATRVLEVGCGVGRVASLTDPSLDYTGVDIAAAAVDAAARNFPHHTFEHVGGSRLPWPDGHFELSMTVAVLHHNEEPVRQRMLEEIARVTRVGGRMLLLEDVVGSWRPGDNVFPMSIGDLLRSVAEAPGSFAVEHLESVGYRHLRGARSVLLKLLRRA